MKHLKSPTSRSKILIYRTLASRSLLQCSPPPRRCVRSGDVLDGFLISNTLQLLPSLPILPAPTPRWAKVPQRPYDHGRRQWNFEQMEAVSFSIDGLPGIDMGHAIRKQFAGLHGRDDPVLQGTAGAISCRLMVWLFTLLLPRIRTDIVSSSPAILLTPRPR